MLDDVRLLNVALTGNPVNTVSQIREGFMKSINAVEEYKNEKTTNPDIENQLEVKNHNHSRDTKLNYRRKNMVEEKEETKPEEESKEESEETSEESEAPAEETQEESTEESENSESSDVESKSELKALREEVDGLKKENAEIKALLKKPVHKSMAEPQKKDEPAEQKSVEPLDAIA